MRHKLLQIAAGKPSRLFVVACLLLALAQPAAAYTDPGSGLLLWQAMGAFLAGAIYYFRSRVARVFRALGLGRAPHDDPQKRS